MTPRRPRRAARVAVLAPDGAVLLLRSDNVEIGVHWMPPGGGIDPGETPRQGAAREVREETGWSDVEPGELLCTWEHDFTHQGVPVRQREHIYVTSVPERREVPVGVVAAHAEDGILELRWWARADLLATAEQIWPPGLGKLLDGRLPGDPPVDLGFVPNR
ncbi:NUDIX hydrolase [Streptomyces sp. NPDC060194]|uniref:NUDIX hydrolase n=1 Tax=Streptomyces sp. NPDC060194 TaxID=3347069 RepID=UPI00366268FF